MSTYVLIPGAGGVAWYWSRVVPLLEQAGHRAIAIDLPGADKTAGLAEYADITVAAADGAGDIVLVAQSLGGFTAGEVCRRLALRELVFVNAMIPNPGESAGEWWDDVGSEAARVAAAEANGYPAELDLETYFLHDVDPAVAAEAARVAAAEANGYPAEFDLETSFLHDVDPVVAAEGEPYQQPEDDVVFEGRCSLERWPDIPIRVLAGADDRFFPVDFQRAVAKERLGVEADVLPGGHLIALSNARGLADYLLAGAA